MTIFDGLKKGMAPSVEHTSPVDFLMVAGDGRDDEVIFRWANELGKDGTVANVTTVSLGSRNTEAGCTLTQGVTGKPLPLFPIHSIINKNRCLGSSSKARKALIARKHHSERFFSRFLRCDSYFSTDIVLF
jgi:hypothetical protein